MQWQVAVIGAGAAGLLAAERAAHRGPSTLLIEKNRKPGAKILMSGGTRCNVTQATDRRGIAAAFGQAGRFLHSALAALGPGDLVALLEEAGVATKVEPNGKVFPVSDRARDVLSALVGRLERSGAELALGEPVVEVVRVPGRAGGGGFRVVTARRTLRTERVIVTTGGCSYPGCGTTGDGYRWLRALGHTIVPPRPALTAITTDAAWVRALRGVAVADVDVRVIEVATAELDDARDFSPRRSLATCRGAFLFTHFGVSGPAALNISREITARAARRATGPTLMTDATGAANAVAEEEATSVGDAVEVGGSHAATEPGRALALCCDFLPAIPADALDARIRRACDTAGKRRLVALLADELAAELTDGPTDGSTGGPADGLAHRLVDRPAQQLSQDLPDAPAAALPRRLVATLVERAGLSEELRASGLSRVAR
ncbi:MAG: aminoacetone oxidase family FAD-binding enzyme, partial [Candidatus Eiseniibacteriota bacterium]